MAQLFASQALSDPLFQNKPRDSNEMEDLQYVEKRSGKFEEFNVKEIEDRIRGLCELDPPLTSVKWRKVTNMTRQGAVNKIKTEDIDELSTANAASLTSRDPEYGILASRIAISNLHKMTPSKFSECIDKQFHHIHPKLNTPAPLISEYHYNLIMNNASVYDEMVRPERDYNRDYFSYKTLEKSYLKRVGSAITDRPSYMFLRVAIALHETDFERVKETYELTSQGYFTHATPTLFNSCTPNQQLASCFLLVNQADSIDGLYNTLKQLAFISKSAGGIGLAYQDVRASDSYIRGTHGFSKGPIPFAKCVNDTLRAVDQGGGKRNGAGAMYTEPWHANIVPFLQMKAVGGDENQRCRDLFPAMWLPDLFFKRVEEDGNWSLFCPNEAPGLSDVWGSKFDELYSKYEHTPTLVRETVKAKRLFRKMIGAMIESGLYMCSKDAVNSKSNHQHLGTIKCMNLCTEVAQYCDPDEISVCTLASIALPMFIKDGKFDHGFLHKVTRVVTRNLDIVIDKNNYPNTGDDEYMVELPDELMDCNDPEKFKAFLKSVRENPKKHIKPVNRAQKSSRKHRPIGIGVQGLADVFILLGMPFDSPEAALLNKEIFETIYHAALSESVQLAKEKGAYETYPGSPISKGIYQFDFWQVKPSERWDWIALDKERQIHGIRNSLLVAPMPTKSTSHILGNNECFEPYHSMIFKARVLAGEFDVINKHLIRILKDRGLWCKDMREKILANRGSVQNVEGFPEDLKSIFKTVWEIKMKNVIDMAADRAAFIDQSQSMNLWLPSADISTIASMIMYAWKKGLKTLCYYLHIRAAADTLAYTVAPEVLFKKMMKTEDNPEDERYTVTTTLDEKSVLNVDVNPLHPDEEDSRDVDYSKESPNARKKRKRQQQTQNQEEDSEEDIFTCPYDDKNPNKKTCRKCTS